MNILIVHHNQLPELRATNRLSLEAWRRHAGCTVAYHNTYISPLPQALLAEGFDVVVFHSLFMSEKWTAEAWGRARSRVAALRDYPALKLAFPQDEFLGAGWVADFLREWKVDWLFTLGDASAARALYGDVVDGLQVSRVLPGYLDDAPVAAPPPVQGRPVDLFYRTWEAPTWTGRFGRLKSDIAHRAKASPEAEGLTLDISTRAQDVILGSAWQEALRSSRAVLGVEGGAGLADPIGQLRDEIDVYATAHPDADFETIARRFFPAGDSLRYRSLSPRHLEACAAGAVQVLVEGDYSGVLKAGEHYLPVAEDLSNLDEALRRLRGGEGLQAMADAAFEAVVGSGRYTWKGYFDALMPELRAAAESKSALPADGSGRALLRHEALQNAALALRFASDYPDWSPASRRDRASRALASRLQAKVRRQAEAGTLCRDPPKSASGAALVEQIRARRHAFEDRVAFGAPGAVLDRARAAFPVVLSDESDFGRLDLPALAKWLTEAPTGLLVFACFQRGMMPPGDVAAWQRIAATGRVILLGPQKPFELFQCMAVADLVLNPKAEGALPRDGVAEIFAAAAGAPVADMEAGAASETVVALLAAADEQILEDLGLKAAPLKAPPPPEARKQVAILALSPIADDPRVRRQGDALAAAGYDVMAFGLPGARSAPPAWPIHIVGEQEGGVDLATILRMASEVPSTEGERRGRVLHQTIWKWLKPLLAGGLRAVYPLALRLRPGLAGRPLSDRVWFLDYYARLASIRTDASRSEEIYWSLTSLFADLYKLASAHKADIWIANDWNTLPIAAHLALFQDALYVYDTHELAYDEHSENAVWRTFLRPAIYAIEHKYIGGANAVSAVSDGICERLKSLHDLAVRPTCIRNTPLYTQVPFHPTGEKIRVLYHGIVVPGRGLEACIRSVARWRPEFEFVLRGPVGDAYRAVLEREIAAAGVANRVTLAPPVPTAELVKAASAFDVGLFALPGHSKHNAYALPNKLFEYCMAGLALCVSDMPEMKSAVEQASMGVVFEGADPITIATAINSLDRVRIDAFKRKALEAARDLCWERERERMLALYGKSFSLPPMLPDRARAALRARMVPPLTPPAGAKALLSAGPKDVIVYDFWKNAGTITKPVCESLRITTPEMPWHYAAGLAVSFDGVDFEREYCWARLRFASSSGGVRVSFFDGDNDDIALERDLGRFEGEREVLISVPHPVGELLLFRNGQEAGPHSFDFLSFELLTAPR